MLALNVLFINQNCNDYYNSSSNREFNPKFKKKQGKETTRKMHSKQFKFLAIREASPSQNQLLQLNNVFA